jgi:hypothetical protein
MTLHFTETEQQQYEASLKEIHFHSALGFVNSTNGFRRGNMHLFIAGTGAGKSTLTRTIIRDLLFNKSNSVRVCVWLTEETITEYKTIFSLGVVSHDVLLNTNAYSQQDNQDVTEFYFYEWLRSHTPDVVIMDNITTSKFYEGKRPDEQARFASKLKNILKELNCAGIIVAHADSQQTNQKGGLLDINNIRGSKTICNLAEFAYLIQVFKTPKAIYSTLRIAKSRSQEIVHDTYILNYESTTKSFINDTAIPFDRFKDVYNQRNKL